MPKESFMPLKVVTDANDCITNGLFNITSDLTGSNSHTPVSGTSFKIVTYADVGNCILNIGFSFSKRLFWRIGVKNSRLSIIEWSSWNEL